jgi:hypothetical protein
VKKSKKRLNTISAIKIIEDIMNEKKILELVKYKGTMGDSIGKNCANLCLNTKCKPDKHQLNNLDATE